MTQVRNSIVDIAKVGFELPASIEAGNEMAIHLEADIEEIINQLHLAKLSGEAPNGAKSPTADFFDWKRKAKSALTIKKIQAKWVNAEVKKINRRVNSQNGEAGARWKRKYEGQRERGDRLQGEIDDLRETLHAIAQIVTESPSLTTRQVVDIIYSTLDLLD